MFNKQLRKLNYSDDESKDIRKLFSKIKENKPSSLRKIQSNIIKRKEIFSPTQKLKIVKIDEKLGEHHKIYWGVVPSLFGDLLVAITYHGLCGMAFCSHYGVQLTLETLSKKWEGKLIQRNDDILEFSKKIFSGSDIIPVHLLGTNFQVDVWRSLMKIPYANLETYSFIATDVGHKLAVRAVASAIGSNPISWLIPCHRIISKSFHLSGYNWGIHQKASLLAHEFQVTAQRFFELQYCCLKRSCELKKIKYGELEARGS